MKAHQGDHRVATVCQVLGVSASGYYAWHHRPLSARAQADGTLTEQICAIHTRSRGTYGAPRIHAELSLVGRPRDDRRERAIALQVEVVVTENPPNLGVLQLQEAEQVVERAVFHHQDDDVLERGVRRHWYLSGDNVRGSGFSQRR